MAAWIRRVDPSRPLHSEGAISFDLDAPNPVSDLVCPMYAPVERIVRWSREGRDRRRPLILCEYGHAMGQAGGLDDYWAVFGVEPGLQGGFVWEWADHALRRVDADGTTWLAYGGDFGEQEHDGHFVCDGLVSADRVPHPLLGELASLAQPVTVGRAPDGRLRVHNRRWFTDLSGVGAAWEAVAEGVVVGSGRLELPAVGARSSADLDDPAAALGAGTLTITFRPRRPPSWAGPDWALATCQLINADATRPAPPHRRQDTGRGGVDTDGIAVGDLRLAWPRLSLWRAPTDNDDPPGAWRPTPGPAGAWRAAGLDRLTHGDVEIRRRGTTITRIITYPTASGARIVHRQTARPVAGGVELTDDVRIDRSLDDLPRVGVAFTLPAGFEQLSWSGLGPGSSYPDRRAAVRRGTWRSTVAEQRLPFVMPQEHGLHLDTDWLEVASASQASLSTPTDRSPSRRCTTPWTI